MCSVNGFSTLQYEILISLSGQSVKSEFCTFRATHWCYVRVQSKLFNRLKPHTVFSCHSHLGKLIPLLLVITPLIDNQIATQHLQYLQHCKRLELHWHAMLICGSRRGPCFCGLYSSPSASVVK